MERLVHLLNEVDNADMSPKQFLNETDHSAVPLIRSLLEQLMITPGGHLNWDMKDELDAYGYRLVPIEQDRWGWILGAVVTDNGMITFG
jgi:hypothetical protein